MKQKNMSQVPVVVAFEHHIHFNCFDALFAKKSYRDWYDILIALEIVRNTSGSIYNPYLVDIFSKFINFSIEDSEGNIKKIV